MDWFGLLNAVHVQDFECHTHFVDEGKSRSP